MGILSKLLPLIAQIFVGVGVGEVLDKVAPDKVPFAPGEPVSPGLKNPNKLIWFVITMVAGAIAWRFIARKLKINF